MSWCQYYRLFPILIQTVEERATIAYNLFIFVTRIAIGVKLAQLIPMEVLALVSMQTETLVSSGWVREAIWLNTISFMYVNTDFMMIFILFSWGCQQQSVRWDLRRTKTFLWAWSYRNQRSLAEIHSRWKISSESISNFPLFLWTMALSMGL